MRTVPKQMQQNGGSRGLSKQLITKKSKRPKQRGLGILVMELSQLLSCQLVGNEGTARKFGYMFMDAFRNVPPQDGVDDLGAKSLYTNLQTDEYEEPDACFVPQRLLSPRIPARHPCDHDGNPWPTIILEVASSESLEHVKDKVNNYWLVPNRAGDVILIKLGNWKKRRRDQNGNPLRRLLCQKFCRHATLQQNPNAKENIRTNSRAVISSLPFPPQTSAPLAVPGVAIDLYDIQQLIFRHAGPN
ncbi:12786_t:CDS:2 [Acaulospora morrowiae]|uniref:12786_t:CDS:1 n=1 Tax=Acaulospora morrowiae TaxID=94023 RepID=A0A9N9CIT7_9GLOM|nr:12786_t:CDS:2 [Acaulospora morrowiae]